jgi:hypothetical protein
MYSSSKANNYEEDETMPNWSVLEEGGRGVASSSPFLRHRNFLGTNKTEKGVVKKKCVQVCKNETVL